MSNPRFALWLLRRCGGSGGGEALVGDLMEEIARGHSRCWLWEQMFWLVGFEVVARARKHARLTPCLVALTLGVCQGASDQSRRLCSGSRNHDNLFSGANCRVTWKRLAAPSRSSRSATTCSPTPVSNWAATSNTSACRKTSAVTPTPASVRDDQAAAISFGGVTALVFLRKGQIKIGDDVLVNGASGPVGSAAVQLAKHFGARVTGVCSSSNVDLVKLLGSDDVIDYTERDFTTTGAQYDLIVDTAGTAPFERSKPALKPKGRLLGIVGTLSEMLKMPWVALTSDKRIIAGPVAGTAQDLRFLAGLAESGQFTPVIDRCFPFDQIVDAHRYLDAGHKKGNIVVTV